MSAQIFDIKNLTLAYIGGLTPPNFQRIKDARVPGLEQFGNAKEEISFFESRFQPAYANNRQDASRPIHIPEWRKFSIHPLSGGSFYGLHPLASETAFPPARVMLIKMRQASLECCDVEIDKDGKITTVKLSPMAAIYEDKVVGTRVIQLICDRPELVGSPSLSPGAENPFHLNIEGSQKEITSRFEALRLKAGQLLQSHLQKPPYFPAPSGTGQ